MLEAAVTCTIMSGLISAYLLAYNPSNVGAIISVLSVVFGLAPGFAFYIFEYDSFYAFRGFQAAGNYLYDPQTAEPALFFMSALTLTFSVGAAFSIHNRTPARFFASPEQTRVAQLNVSNLRLSIAFGLILWTGLLAFSIARSGVNLEYAFVPVVRGADEADQRIGFVYGILMSLPPVLLILEAWSPARRRWRMFAIFAIGVLTCLTTHQRRELITLLMVCGGVMIFLPRPNSSVSRARARLSQMIERPKRTITLLFMGLGIVMIPLGWYARVYATSVARGQAANAFEIRDFSEILMGSPATGYAAFTIIYDYVERFGISPLRLAWQIVATPIPRFLWPDKPSDVDGILQNTYGLYENPSTFWFGELYFNFGMFAVALAFLMGLYATKAHSILSSSKSIFHRGIAVLFFAYSVTFFKNGIYTGLLRFGIAFALLWGFYAVLRISQRSARLAVSPRRRAAQTNTFVHGPSQRKPRRPSPRRGL